MTMLDRIIDAQGTAGALTGLAGSVSVRTPCGPRRVENVRPGDLIVTRDNGLRPVRMVWRRLVTAAEMDADPSLAPVRLRPRAIGPMMPARDLLIAADHRVLVPGYRLAHVPDTQPCLIAARDIVAASDQAFFDRKAGGVTFHNLVFDEHQVFSVDGLPVESYLPSRAALPDLDETVRGGIAQLVEAGDPAPRYAPPPVADYRPEFV